jgi:hypothetical protein
MRRILIKTKIISTEILSALPVVLTQSPPRIENNWEKGNGSIETLQIESSSSILQMVNFVLLNYGVVDNILNKMMRQT